MKQAACRILFVLTTTVAVDARADAASRSADNVARAEEFFRQGTRSFEAERYSEAYGALRSAFDLSPGYRTAAGLGQVELHLEQFRDAAEHLAYCLRHFPSDGDPEARRHVEEGLDQAREHIAALRIRVNVEKAKVAVDGAPVGVAPLEGLVFVEPGAHTATALLDGYSTAEEAVEAPLRMTRDVSLTLTPVLPAASSVAPPTPPAATTGSAERKMDATAGLPPSTWAIIIGGSLTAVALGTTIAFELNRASADGDVHDLRNSLAGKDAPCAPSAAALPPACSALRDAVDRRGTAQDEVIAGAITTGVLAAATVGAALLLPSGSASSGGDHRSARGVSFGFASMPDGGRLTVGGLF